MSKKKGKKSVVCICYLKLIIFMRQGLFIRHKCSKIFAGQEENFGLKSMG